MAEHSNSSESRAEEGKGKGEGEKEEDQLGDKVVVHKHDGTSTHERYIDHSGKVRRADQ